MISQQEYSLIMNVWIDRYWLLIDAGCQSDSAISKVCSEFGLTSYDEDKIKEELPKDPK